MRRGKNRGKVKEKGKQNKRRVSNQRKIFKNESGLKEIIIKGEGIREKKTKG
jgi:hypothetical protein